MHRSESQPPSFLSVEPPAIIDPRQPAWLGWIDASAGATSMRIGLFSDSLPPSGDHAASVPPSPFLPLGDSALAAAFVAMSLEIVRESRGPMRLWEFAARLRHRLDMPPAPFIEWCDAVKSTLARIDDSRLRILAPDMPGVGYVFDAADPDSAPVRSSH